MKLTKYPDGTSYVNETVLGQQVFRVNSYEDLWHLNQFVDAFHSQHSTLTVRIKPNIIIPCLIDAQQDRRFNKGESSGLKLVCKFLSSLEANFWVFHPHNGEALEMGMDNVEIIDNSEFITEVLREITIKKYETYETPISYQILNYLPKDLILMSTDGGSYKWINKTADKIGWKGEVYGASKSRKFEDSKSKLTQYVDRQDFEGKDVLVLDDICINGGTFVGLAKMLKERNCGKLYLAISHLTVAEPNPELFELFDAVYTTDSKGLDYKIPTTGHDRGFGITPQNLKVINLFK